MGSIINSLDIIEPQELTTAAAETHDIEISSTKLWVTCASDNDEITGMVPPMDADGMTCTIRNVSASNTLVIPNDDAGSTEGFRFILAGGSTSLALEPWQTQEFVLKSGMGWVANRPGTFS